MTERNACVIAVDRVNQQAVARAKKANAYVSFIQRASLFHGSNVMAVREDFKIKSSIASKSYRKNLTKVLEESSRIDGEPGLVHRSSVYSQAAADRRMSVLNSPKKSSAENQLQDSYIGIHLNKDLSSDLKDLKINSEISQRIIKEGFLTEENWKRTMDSFRKTGEKSRIGLQDTIQVISNLSPSVRKFLKERSTFSEGPGEEQKSVNILVTEALHSFFHGNEKKVQEAIDEESCFCKLVKRILADPTHDALKKSNQKTGKCIFKSQGLNPKQLYMSLVHAGLSEEMFIEIVERVSDTKLETSIMQNIVGLFH